MTPWGFLLNDNCGQDSLLAILLKLILHFRKPQLFWWRKSTEIQSFLFEPLKQSTLWFREKYFSKMEVVVHDQKPLKYPTGLLRIKAIWIRLWYCYRVAFGRMIPLWFLRGMGEGEWQGKQTSMCTHIQMDIFFLVNSELYPSGSSSQGFD